MALFNEPRQWPGFLAAIGRPDLADDPRFATSAARKEHASALVQVLDAVFAQRDLAAWRTLLDAAGVTFGAVQSVNETAEDVQMQQSGALVPEVCGDEMSVGMAKFYRVACFKEIGGFVRQVMWDGIDCHRCRMLCWIAESVDLSMEDTYRHMAAGGSPPDGTPARAWCVSGCEAQLARVFVRVHPDALHGLRSRPGAQRAGCVRAGVRAAQHRFHLLHAGG